MTTPKQAWREWKYAAKYRNPIYKEYLYLKDRLWAWWKGVQVKRAKNLAAARHKTDGKTYYVLFDAEGRPRSFNNKEIKRLQAAGLMSKHATVNDLYREAIWIANAKSVFSGATHKSGHTKGEGKSATAARSSRQHPQ